MKKLILIIISTLICGIFLKSCDSEKSLFQEPEKSSECDILEFIDEINSVIWEINGTDITATYPEGSDLSSIAPVITVSEKASINPRSDEKVDFSNEKAVTYTVTAEDGTEKVYKAQAKDEKGEVADDNMIVNGNSSWANLTYGLGSWGIPCNVSTQYVYFDEDSIVAGSSYKKVFSCNDRLRENIMYEGLIREQNKKTYFVPANSETEYLLYDFSLEEGISFEYRDFRAQESATFYVNSVDFIEINGSTKKRIQISYGDLIVDTWIEGIGSLNGILYPCYRLFMSGGVRELLCYYQNDEFVYENSTYTGCYYDKPEEVIPFMQQPDIGVSVYPNPVYTDDLLTISSPDEIILSVKLIDILADEVIYSNDNVNTNTYFIDVSVLQNGFYVFAVWLKNGQGGYFIVYKL